MGVINKISFICGGGAPTEFTIGLIDTDDSGINAILATIPVSYGTYTYSHTVNGGSVTSQLTANESSGCQATLFKDNVGYSTSGACCATIEPSSLLSTDAGNLLSIGTDGRIYFNGSGGVDIYVDGATINPLNFELTLTDNSGATPNVVLPLNILRQTTAPIVVQGISYASGTDFQTILDALVDCCPTVNTTALTTVVNPAVTQTANFNEYVVDSAGNKFYIDNDGTAVQINTPQTPFSLTVNAGTTNVATDDSLGTATVGNGGVIHLWSSDGSIQFGVVQGSAETNVQTNSTIIPFTASVPVGNDAGLASTNVQDAIDEVDSKVEVLEEVQKPWAAETDTQRVNSENVTVVTNVFQDARVNIASNPVLTPFDLEYKLKVGDDALNIGHSRIYGVDVRNEGFRMRMLNSHLTTQQVVFIDPINGIDNLEPTAYFGATALSSGTPATTTTTSFGFKFKTFSAFVIWANRCEAQYIVARIQNTTALTPLILTGVNSFMNKHDIDIFSDSGISYIQIAGSLFYSNVRYCGFANLDITFTGNGNIRMFDDSEAYPFNTTFNFSTTSTQGAPLRMSNGAWHIDANIAINLTANNQSIFQTNGNYGGNVIFSNHATGFVINTGAFTGCTWIINSYNLTTYIPKFLDGGLQLTIPASVDMSLTAIYYGNLLMLNNKLFVAPAPVDEKSLYLGGASPLKTIDVTSNTADNTGTKLSTWTVNEIGNHLPLASEWTTSTRPIAPRLGQDGWNSTLSSREYWNGTIWKAY